MSPWIEKSWLRLSANVSDENAARDFEELTGIVIGHRTQQRLVHRTDWVAETATVMVNALSLDGRKARIRTPAKGPSVWLDDKAVSLQGIRCEAWVQENEALLESVNSQPLAHNGNLKISAEFSSKDVPISIGFQPNHLYYSPYWDAPVNHE